MYICICFFNPFLFLLFDFFDESIFLASLSHLLLYILFKLDYVLIIHFVTSISSFLHFYTVSFNRRNFSNSLSSVRDIPIYYAANINLRTEEILSREIARQVIGKIRSRSVLNGGRRVSQPSACTPSTVKETRGGFLSRNNRKS